MAEDKNDEDRQIDRARTELMQVLQEFAGGVIAEDAAAFWLERYEKKFRNAIRVKRKNYERDRAVLKEKAKELVAAARRRAGSGPITGQHAKDASEETDCPQFGSMQDWCN